MKERVFISDSNGTLTFARQPIQGELAETLTEFTRRYKFVVVTGSSWHEIKDHMPEAVVSNPNVDFWCSMGNTLYREGKEVYNSKNTIDFDFFYPILEDIVRTCPYQFGKSYSRHYEVNGNSINFTMLGRPLDGEPTLEERSEYAAWDEEVGQRRWIVEFLSKLYPEYDISIGGQISIDIVKKGADKSQILEHYKDMDITFFGDRIGKMGNDNLMSHQIADIGGTVYAVDSPEETMFYMQAIMERDDEDAARAEA